MTVLKIRQVFFVALAVTLVGIGAAVVTAQQPPAIGSPAPDFALGGVDGKTHTLSEYKGKIVVLEWTNPGCPVVQRHYRDGLMPAVQKECTAKGIVWLAINSTTPKHPNYQEAGTLKKTYEDWKAAFTALLMDPEGKTGKAFDAKTTPHLFVIDQQGRLAYNGAIDDDSRGENPNRTNYVKLAVDALLKGEPVATTTTRSYGCSVKYAQ
jgi:peroxiredoxin